MRPTNQKHQPELRRKSDPFITSPLTSAFSGKLNYTQCVRNPANYGRC